MVVSQASTTIADGAVSCPDGGPCCLVWHLARLYPCLIVVAPVDYYISMALLAHVRPMFFFHFFSLSLLFCIDTYWIMHFAIAGYAINILSIICVSWLTNNIFSSNFPGCYFPGTVKALVFFHFFHLDFCLFLCNPYANQKTQ